MQAVVSGAGEVIWQRTLVDAVYTTVAVSGSDSSVVAGTWLNPPMQVELIPAEGPAVPDWFHSGTVLSAGASRDAQVVAAVDATSGDSTVTVYKWLTGSGTPDWSFPIHPASAATHRTVAVSADGSTIGVLVTMIGTPLKARLYAFGPGSSTPLWFFDAPAGTFARNLAVSDGGDYLAFRSGSYVHVIERATGAARWSENFFFSSDPIAISGDGDVIAYGSTGLFVREWNGAAYGLSWAVFDGAFNLSTCALSSDGSALGVGWHRPAFTQSRVQLYDLPSSTPRWTYLYASFAGPYQDLPSDLSLTADGSLLAVGSLGDSLNTNPEIHVFSRADSMPMLTVDTPGSVFDVHVASTPNGEVYLAACGKHVHANEVGRGGDLYSIRMPSVPVATPVTGRPSGIALDVGPNPFTGELRMQYRVAADTPVRVSVFSMSGRRVRQLRVGERRGAGFLVWNGTDEDGRPLPAGVYFVRLSTPSTSLTKKAVLLR